MLKLKLQYFGHLIGRVDSLEKTQMLGGIGGRRRRGRQRMRWLGWHHRLDGHEFGWTLGVGDGQRGLACCNSWGRKESDVAEWLNWTDVNSWLIGKVLDAGKNRGQKRRRASEEEMAGRHHWCNGHELGQTLRDDEGQRGLMCCSPWSCKELNTIGELNNNNNKWFVLSFIILCISVLSFVTSL